MASNKQPRQLFDSTAQVRTPERIKYDELMEFARFLAIDFPVLKETTIILKQTSRGYAYCQEELIPRRIYIPKSYLWDYPLLTSQLLLIHETCHQILGMPKKMTNLHGKEFQEKETELMLRYLQLRPIYSIKDDYGTIGYAVEFQSSLDAKIYHKWKGTWR